MTITVHKKGLFIYLLALVSSIVFSSFYGGPVSYAFLYAMLLLIPTSIIYIFINNHFLQIYQEIEVHKLTKGEDHKYRALVENAGLFPVHNMKLGILKDRCTLYEIEDGRSITLGVLGKDELTSAINCKYAGAYDIGIETVAFTDPFKIFTVRLDIPYSFRVIVSPRVTDIADKVLDLENQVNNSGFKSSNLMEDSPGNDLREYIKGDPLKAINWKVSAKQSKLIVRVPEPMEKRTVTILLQASDIPESEQDIEYLKRRDQFLEFAVSAAYHFGKRGVPIRLIYPSGTVTESIVNSYESFLEFYNMAADGIYYGQADAFTEIANLSKEIRNNERGSDTYIIIREDYENPEDFCTICG